jgi:serine/threonine protein kinase
VIYRDRFEHDRPYDREFEGIQKFEPISRSHESQVDILHIGRNDAAGYFYYVMELADSVGGSGVSRLGSGESRDPRPQTPDPTTYIRHTLKLDLYRRGRLPVDECIHIGLALTTALENLHSHGLVHRDIKPSNIIFVGGVPKLADIGRVASMDATMSFVGTSGFLPPEGPGTPHGDIYSLGKVLYEISMGRDRQEFPKLPANLAEFDDASRLLELNAVILKACHRDSRKRYESAQEMRGESVKRKMRSQRRLAAVTKISLISGLIALIVIVGFLLARVMNDRRPGSSGGTLDPEMKGTKNREPWNVYVKGQHYFNRDTRDGSTRGIEYLKEATRLDPNFAQPYAALAEIYRWSDYLFRSGYEAMTEGKKAALRALALDDSLAKAHLELGCVAAHLDRDFYTAEKELKRSMTLSPEYASAHGCYGWILLEMGRLGEAEKEMRLAQRLDPISPRLYCNAPCVFRSADRENEAVEQIHKALDLHPDYFWALEQLAAIHEEKDEFPEAIEILQKARIANEVNELDRARIDTIVRGPRRPIQQIGRNLDQIAAVRLAPENEAVDFACETELKPAIGQD